MYRGPKYRGRGYVFQKIMCNGFHDVVKISPFVFYCIFVWKFFDIFRGVPFYTPSSWVGFWSLKFEIWAKKLECDHDQRNKEESFIEPFPLRKISSNHSQYYFFVCLFVCYFRLFLFFCMSVLFLYVCMFVCYVYLYFKLVVWCCLLVCYVCWFVCLFACF